MLIGRSHGLEVPPDSLCPGQVAGCLNFLVQNSPSLDSVTYASHQGGERSEEGNEDMESERERGWLFFLSISLAADGGRRHGRSGGGVGGGSSAGGERERRREGEAD